MIQEFTHPSHDPDDANDSFTYERLGGVLFLRPEVGESWIVEYNVDFVENPIALPTCALPSAVSALFSSIRDETGKRESQRYADDAHFEVADVF